MLSKIKEELSCIKAIRIKVKKKINNSNNNNNNGTSDNKLRCAVCKGHYQYYIGKQYLKNKERKLAVQLAKKEYYEKLDKEMARYEKALTIVEDFVENERLQNVYRKLHPARKVLVDLLYLPVESLINEFEQVKYEGKCFDEKDKTEYFTIKGERVRSKSEKIIADELYRNGIPYKYEFPIELEAWNRKITIYPDFTVLNKRTGKRWIIEHLGMMDNEAYYESAMQKLDTYEKNNILMGRDLIILHETSTNPFKIKTLEKYINEFLC